MVPYSLQNIFIYMSDLQTFKKRNTLFLEMQYYMGMKYERK